MVSAGCKLKLTDTFTITTEVPFTEEFFLDKSLGYAALIAKPSQVFFFPLFLKVKAMLAVLFVDGVYSVRGLDRPILTEA